MSEKVTIPGEVHVDPKNLEEWTTQNETNGGWMHRHLGLSVCIRSCFLFLCSANRLRPLKLLLLVLLLLSCVSRVQLCATPQTGSPPGSPIPGLLQARTLEWVAISFSNAWKWKVKVKLFSRVWLLATPWTAAYQAPLSMGFSRQEYWSGVPLPSPTICSLVED